MASTTRSSARPSQRTGRPLRAVRSRVCQRRPSTSQGGFTAAVPFALWKQPDRLPAVLAELVGRFPDADELAVTMTGELCDCFETKRDGVHAIIKAVRFASGARPIRVWSTDGAFLDSEEAKQNHMKVAAANGAPARIFALLPD